MTTAARIIDYDSIEEWSPWMDEIFSSFTPTDFLPNLADDNVKFIEDARDLVIKRIGRETLIENLNSALQRYPVRLFHGTRVTDEDLQRIREFGLQPLMLIDRRDQLAAIFSRHPDWANRKKQLDAEIHRFGAGWMSGGAGKREDGCIHFCVSRSGLLYGCNHYLTHGAEVDQHIAKVMFDDEFGLELLQCQRKARIISITMPFMDAARAVNPWGFHSTDFPGLLGMLVGTWAFRKSHPTFSVKKQRDATAARLPGPIGPEHIESVEEINDAEFERGPS